MSEFAFNLLLVFFPGIMCASLIDLLDPQREWKQFQFVVNSFLLGILSYLIYAALVYAFSLGDLSSIWFFNAGERLRSPDAVLEILYVTVVSATLAVTLVAIDNRKWHFHVLQQLKITDKFGERDVWGYLMNSPDTEWATVRDVANNLMYFGYIKAFSDSAQEAELLLERVIVYANDTGIELYRVDVQYLSLSRGDIAIEVMTTPPFGADHVRESSQAA